jgi:hypothetical protein
MSLRLHNACRPKPTLVSWQTAISLKGTTMEAVQTNPQAFNYRPIAPLPRTLDDLRMVHDNYATAGSFSASSMQPVLIAAVVIALGAGIVVGVNKYSDNNASKISAASKAPDPSVPSAVAVSAASNVPVPAASITASDSPITDPLKSMTKSEEANSMPLAGHGNNHSSESLNPVKAKTSVAAKSASTPVKRIAPPVTPSVTPPAIEFVPPQAEIVPPTPPAPAPAPVNIEEPPIVPVPAPILPPSEPPKL